MAEKDVDLSQYRVLLAEDEKFAQRLIVMALKHIGIERVTLVEDGVAALKWLEAHGNGLDIVISDWNMPSLNGMELLRIVRNQWPHLIFVMLTGNATLSLVQEAMKIGIDGYLVKPFAPDQIRAKLTAAIKKRQGIPA